METKTKKKKELTGNEKLLMERIPEITNDSDPLEDEIDSIQSREDEIVTQYNDTQEQLNSLVEVSEPVEPKPKVKSVAGVTFGITGVVVVLLFVFHCIIWLLRHIFDITWNTWGWTTSALLYGVIISLVCTAIAYYADKKEQETYENNVNDYNNYVNAYNTLTNQLSDLGKELENVQRTLRLYLRDRFDTLGYAMNTVLGLPYPSASITDDNYDKLKRDYLGFLDAQNRISAIPERDEQMKARKILMDKKLEFLYNKSIRAEVSPEVYKEFSAQYGARRGNEMALRQELPIQRSKGNKEISNLPTYKGLLNHDTLTPIVNKFEAVTNRNTSKDGFFSFMTDTDKKAEQTRDMQTLAKAAKVEYDELMDINKKVSYALDFTRGCAYRNIYLGAELINYVRAAHGGGSLTTEQDGTAMTEIKSDGLQLDTSNINVNVSGSALNTLGFMANAVMDNKGLQQLVKDNPKVSLGVAAVASIGSAAVSYFSNLSKNANAQKQMVDAIKAISEGYTEGKANMLRAIEIIQAIVECNKGFMTIYEPLRKKVFDDGDYNLTKDEQANLALAVNKYKKVTEAKIK